MILPDFVSEYTRLFDAIQKVVPPSMKIYLVGGAVRDILLGRKIRDFDFSTEGLVRPIGKHIANELGGAYYVLDDEREMVRVIIDDEHMGQFDIDIAQFSGDGIEEDLRARDFTMNAMAIEISDVPVFVDPLCGYEDLQQKHLRMCSADSLVNDPMRALRAIRMSLEFDLAMDDELLNAMRDVPSRLSDSSMERYRDEMFKIIRLYQNGKAFRLYEKFNFIDHLFPGWKTSDEAVGTEWIENTDRFALLLTVKTESSEPLDDFAAYAVSRLGNYRETLRAFFDKTLALYHNRRMLTAYAAIVRTLTADKNIAEKWCSRLAFSSSEMNFVSSAVSAFHYLSTDVEISSYNDVDIYRYFRQFREGGVAGLILFLACEYAKQNFQHAYKDWCEKVVLVQDFVSAYFTRYIEVIDPKPLMSGHDIQEILNVPAGPMIGFVKNALIEAQIRSSVRTIEEAESFVRQYAKYSV